MFPKPFFFIITASAVVSLFYFKKFKGTKYVWFLYFIYFTFIIDKINYLNSVYHFINIDGVHNNKPVLNLYIVISFYFFFLFYKSVFHLPANRKIMDVFILLFSIFLLVDIFYFKTNLISQFLAKTAVFGSVLLLITIILITMEFLQNKEMVNNIEHSFIFWITLGCFLFYMGIIPVLIYSKFHLSNGIFNTILVILNTFTHTSFILGFMLSERKYNY